MRHFAVGNGGRRFIHHQNAAIDGNGLHDFNHLLLCDAQIADLRFRTNARIELIQHHLRILLHLPEINAEFAHGFAPQEYVFGNGHMRNQNQFLMNDGNAVIARGVYARDGNFAAIDEDLPLLWNVNAAQYLNERRFSGAVFAQQRVNFTGFQLKIDVLQRLDTRKRFADVFHFEQIFAHLISPPFLYCAGTI